MGGRVSGEDERWAAFRCKGDSSIGSGIGRECRCERSCEVDDVQVGAVGVGRKSPEGWSPPEKGKELGKVPDNGVRFSGKLGRVGRAWGQWRR
jgi:hypothetical protein